MMRCLRPWPLLVISVGEQGATGFIHFFAFFFLGLILMFPSAHATYSIVATEKSTQRVGGAATSCIYGSSVSKVYGSAPGKGAVLSQAHSSRKGRDAAKHYLEQNRQPPDILGKITNALFDPNASYRQYGIVNFHGASGYTGEKNASYASDLQGKVNDYVYSIQGNFLTSIRVLHQSEQSFQSSGCDLADKLILALEAGAQNGQGDSRCRPKKPADAAFIQVDEPTGAIFVRIDVAGSEHPLLTLRQRYNSWRRQNPCGR